MMMKPALVTILVVRRAPGALAAVVAVVGERGGGAQREHPEREERRTDHGGEDTYPQRRWLSSSHPTSPRTWRASPCCGASRSSSSAGTGMTLSGRNGSGKTTLLRMLSGETGIDGGELVFQRACGSRCTTSARRATATCRCATTCSRAARSCWRSRSSWRRWRPRWPRARSTTRRSPPTARAQAQLEHAGGYNWRESVNSTLHGLGFRDEHLDRVAGDVLRRRAHARVAGAGAGGRPGPAAARRAHQPPRHRVAGVAGDASAVARRRDRARGARPLVPRGGRHVGAGARGRPREVLQGHLARVAGREGAARAGARPRDREAAGRDRQARALRRPLPRRHARAPGVVAPEEARQDRPAHDATRRTARASASPSSRPSAPAASSSRSRTGC